MTMDLACGMELPEQCQGGDGDERLGMGGTELMPGSCLGCPLCMVFFLALMLGMDDEEL